MSSDLTPQSQPNKELDKIKDVLKAYLMPTILDGDIPPEVYIAFKGTQREKIKQMWKNCTDSISLVKNTINKSTDIVCKPDEIYVKSYRNNIYYVLSLPSGKIYVPHGVISDDAFETLHQEILYISARREGNLIIADEIRPLMTSPRVELGKELYEIAMQYSIPYTTVISLAYGYEPDPHLSLLTAIRSLSLYKVQNMPIHMVELSPPNTGKTTFAIRNRFAFNWEYIDEVPSYARLVMDARNGALGIVYRANGVAIDEIDKYNGQMKDVVMALLTGMSHGIWNRAKGDKTAPQITRKIPIVFFGNINITALQQGGEIFNVFSNIKLNESTIEALVDRIGVKVIARTRINASDKIAGIVIPDSYLRGFVAYIEQLANKEYKDYGKFEGRRRFQYNQIRSIFENTICYEFDCDKQDLVEQLVNTMYL